MQHEINTLKKDKLLAAASRAEWTSSAGRAAAGGCHVTRRLRRANSRAAPLPPETPSRSDLRACTVSPSSCEFEFCLCCVFSM